MPITPELNAEIRILNLYNLDSVREGLKVHKDADEATKSAIARLHHKGLLTQPDGGYLTDLGVHCAEHLQMALRILDVPGS
ncbi:TIGR02647 family protein [Alkalimonas sp.]|uniref:TIGR02647 family protein n=1 Tax=Alkalimonas sp. TaxID=1872453 RepID=UPI00263BB3B4|nr:TIGR02647 family protein [Alkalimonas sp.]MCC5827659.1 TIGR02647 family protein [Alkalimonas sp.]